MTHSATSHSASTPPSGLVHSARCLEHDSGAGHPERPERLAALMAHFRERGLIDDLQLHTPRKAREAELERNHGADYIRSVRSACAQGPRALDGDTTVSRGSFDAALLASGGLIEATDRVLQGDWKNAFVAMRPPGHHAEEQHAMGFCLFNHVAVAARHLLDERGLQRVAIVDLDVHHGNGTQHAFERDCRVFYGSLHQWPLFPGTGAAAERGLGAGEGTTLNLPLPEGSTDADWIAALEGEMLPALEEFEPQFLLISIGFDGHRRDPLAGTNLTEEGYRRLTRSLVEVARRKAHGRVVSLLEGGYDLEALKKSAEAHVEELVNTPGRASRPTQVEG